MIKNPIRIIVLLIFIVLQSCSNDDEGSSGSNYYLNVEVEGTTLSETTFLGIASSPVIECSTNDELLAFATIGTIETSMYGVDVYLAHYENSSDFDDNTNQNSNVIDPEDFYNNECFEVFDFTVALILNDDWLVFDNSSSNTNNITDINFVSQNSQESIYAISGNFNVSFLDIDGSTVVVTGEYRFPVYVLN